MDIMGFEESNGTVLEDEGYENIDYDEETILVLV